tara:strand:- start:42 stop:221 length:180 start_codon:yes stop_codon:yes gene_type:complete
MFGLFKKKTKKEVLLKKYNELKKRAYETSRINRRESDRLEYEAQEVLKEIDLIVKQELN